MDRCNGPGLLGAGMGRMNFTPGIAVSFGRLWLAEKWLPNVYI